MADLGVLEHWRLLELASVSDEVLGGSGDHDDLDLDDLVAGVDWDQAVQAALKHRLVPRLADFLIRSGRLSAVPKQLRRVLVQALHDNRYKTSLASREAARVVAALVAEGVVVACTKGITFQSTLYGGFGGRTFDDIDLMVHEESRGKVSEVLQGLGYLPNMAHDLDTDRLVPRDRREVAMYRVYPDHLPHFMRPLTGQAVPYFVVDVCFNITWYGAKWQVPMGEVLAELGRVRVPVVIDGVEGAVELPALTTPYDFVFTAMHLFREGWFERTEAFEHLRLGQFADLLRQWRRLGPADGAALTEVIRRHEIGPPIAWACHHVDQVFTSSITEGLGLEEFRDDAWLHSASGVDGSYLSWSGGMRDRLRLGRRPQVEPAPAPPFAADARVGRR
ncbi:nucleotidyltransferase family protein [Saccharothrix algeriensis]|uniref:Nucleotidyltransferase family protein n=1 Tax=Saccharothrix algeriensis TaxID=173560 RepID=A0A8T8HWK6_9PSEU|nr:nucleotidyltransferase family protein [Saccharothrix algeriensis]MBM7814463.1 hypothetical protein [Saccharothrix algeriensis]QTR02761.1 nucleotidyltransferase family protein [Saccharothrix algeriensis]